MKLADYLKILVEEIHSTVIATVDTNGLPVTRVIDIMLYDSEGIYFLTAKGKAFYEQLMLKPYVSLSGMCGGNNTMAKKAISISGSVKNIGTDRLNEIFEKNKYMQEIYSSLESRDALEVFCLYRGQGEFFDLSTKPITRGSFTIGNVQLRKYGYYIADNCSECGFCVAKCPVNCIAAGKPYVISSENCLHCGNCFNICPEKAVVKRN